MNTFKRFLAVIALMSTMLLFAFQAAAAKVTVTTCTGTMVIAGFVEGEASYPGGNYHLRDRQLIYLTDFPDCPAPINGLLSVEANLNWDNEDLSQARGPAWGNWHKQVFAYPDSGFSGIYTGLKTLDGMVLKIVGHGTGAFEGWKVDGTIEFSSDSFFAVYTVNMLNPQDG